MCFKMVEFFLLNVRYLFFISWRKNIPCEHITCAFYPCLALLPLSPSCTISNRVNIHSNRILMSMHGIWVPETVQVGSGGVGQWCLPTRWPFWQDITVTTRGKAVKWGSPLNRPQRWRGGSANTSTSAPRKGVTWQHSSSYRIDRWLC
jgi:hypothetical protein